MESSSEWMSLRWVISPLQITEAKHASHFVSRPRALWTLLRNTLCPLEFAQTMFVLSVIPAESSRNVTVPLPRSLGRCSLERRGKHCRTSMLQSCLLKPRTPILLMYRRFNKNIIFPQFSIAHPLASVLILRMVRGFILVATLSGRDPSTF